MCAASLVYAVRMSESYDIRCRVGARQIVAPIGAGEARIPALVRLRDEHLILFFDERPAPASGTGADFNGLTMASDLPNPNRIRWMERDGRGGWSDPRASSSAWGRVPSGTPTVSCWGPRPWSSLSASVAYGRCRVSRSGAQRGPRRAVHHVRAGAPGQRPSMMAMRGS